MAGTGHEYEIANIADVKASIDALIATAQADPAAVAWLSGRSFLRYATSAPFVFKAKKCLYMPFLDDVSEAERAFILRKLKDGGDVRIFASAEFRRAGPDVDHILDWMAHLKETRPSDHAKIPRMAADDLIRKVAGWIRPKSRKTKLPEGLLSHVLDTGDGYTWVELMDRAALLAEGDAMNHCVDKPSYIHELEMGRNRILSMRDSEGRRLLTMELRGGDDRHAPLYIRQIQAFGNQTPPEGAVRSICDILNHLSVTPAHSNQERRAKIAHVAGQGWQSIYKTWKRIEHAGLECITDGEDLVFMSPVQPGKPLVNVTSFLKGGIRIIGDEISIPETCLFRVRLADERHFPIDELRVAASVARLFHAQIDNASFSIDSKGECVPFVDTLIQQEANGIVFLRDPLTENAYVTHLKDKALVYLEIGRTPRFRSEESTPTFGALPAWISNIARLKPEDFRRCLSVMSVMKASEFGTPARAMHDVARLYEPVRTPDGEWHPFLLEATRRDTRNPDIHWLETPYRLAMYRNGRRQIDFDIHSGELRSLPYLWPDKIDCAEIATRFNTLRIRPADNIWFGRLGTRLSHKRDVDKAHIVFIGGKWKAARSQREILKMTDGVKSISRGAARLLLHCLPEEPDQRIPETDSLYVRCMAEGVLSLEDDDARMPLDKEAKRFLWFYDRLEMLAPGHHKAAVRHAKRLLERWAKQPKSLLPRMDDHIRLFFSVRTHLKASLTAKIIGHIFKKNRYWLGTHPSDLVWIDDVYPSLADERLRGLVYQGIQHGASADTSVTDPAILKVNAACLQIYARRDHILLDYKIEKIESAYRKLIESSFTEDQQILMSDVRLMMDAIPSLVAERLAEVEERRRLRDEMFNRHWGGTTSARAA